MRQSNNVTTTLLVLLLIGSTSQLLVTDGYLFEDIPIPSMKIISPPYPPNKYENSTVTLEVNVYLFSESQKVNSIAYSIDGEQTQYIKNLTVKSPSNFGPGRVGYTVIGKAVLENLADGNHTVKAYTNGLHTSRDFTVNSSYQVTSIKILSPTNQTYTGEIPLIFTVNGNIEEAYYHLYEKEDYPYFYGPNNSNKYPLTGNTTIPLPSEGKYELLITLTTEKGRAEAVTIFSVTTNFSTYYLVAIGIGLVAIVAVGLLLFRRHRKTNDLFPRLGVAEVSGAVMARRTCLGTSRGNCGCKWG